MAIGLIGVHSSAASELRRRDDWWIAVLSAFFMPAADGLQVVIRGKESDAAPVNQVTSCGSDVCVS